MTETGELTYRRVHHASPELLFDCMTTPEHLAHFWGPAGTTTPVGNITVDLRPGYLSPEARAGFSTSLDRFDDYVADLQD